MLLMIDTRFCCVQLMVFCWGRELTASVAVATGASWGE